MKKYFPFAGGILDIIAGSLWIAGYSLFLSILIPHNILEAGPSYHPAFLDYVELCFPMILGIAAIVGGFLACFKRYWRFAVLGSTFAVFGLLGIPALILILLSEKEFKVTKKD